MNLKGIDYLPIPHTHTHTQAPSYTTQDGPARVLIFHDLNVYKTNLLLLNKDNYTKYELSCLVEFGS